MRRKCARSQSFYIVRYTYVLKNTSCVCIYVYACIYVCQWESTLKTLDVATTNFRFQDFKKCHSFQRAWAWFSACVPDIAAGSPNIYRLFAAARTLFEINVLISLAAVWLFAKTFTRANNMGVATFLDANLNVIWFDYDNVYTYLIETNVLNHVLSFSENNVCVYIITSCAIY